MFGSSLKTLVVFALMLLGWVCPGLADVKQGMDAAGRYFDDLQGPDTLESFKARRDLNARQVREAIFQTHRVLRDDPSDLAKAVVERKIKIVRENRFLETELGKGVEILYRKAMEQCLQKQLSACEKNLLEVEMFYPNYKETRDYLNRLKVRDSAKTTSQPVKFVQVSQGDRK